MTRREKEAMCQQIKKLHGYCKRKWLKERQTWVCITCIAKENYADTRRTR
jgi:hypothetical protein